MGEEIKWTFKLIQDVLYNRTLQVQFDQTGRHIATLAKILKSSLAMFYLLIKYLANI